MKTVESALKTVGKRVFIDYYEKLKNCRDKRALAEKLQKDLGSDSTDAQIARINAANRIFENGLEREALENILDSRNISEQTRRKAEKLYYDHMEYLAAAEQRLAQLDSYLQENCKPADDFLFQQDTTLAFLSTEALNQELGKIDEDFTDEGFWGLLKRICSEHGMTVDECCKRAGVGRSIKSAMKKKGTMPVKRNVFKLIIALRLNLEEATQFLNMVGYGFTAWDYFDMTVKFCIENEIYKKSEIDDALFHATNEVLFTVNEPAYFPKRQQKKKALV